MFKLDGILAASRVIKPPRTALVPPVREGDWERAVGSRIARRAQPYRLERGVLTVRVAHVGWANELSLLTEEVRAQLRAGGIEVEALRFVVGPINIDERPRGPAKRAPRRDAPLPSRLAAPLARVEDDALRRALRDAAAKTLDRGR
ncbi:MAG: DUF721 domain-containing protein [Myxococcota bacterium]